MNRSTPNFLTRIKAKIGDFWWYSFWLFLAQRLGDVINAFAGLWLIPLYVSPEELGAVLPLTQGAALFGLPLIILGMVFTKFLNRYATQNQPGKVKSLLRNVLLLALLFVAGGAILAHLLLPSFFERVRVVAGSLEILVILCAITTTLQPLFANALQALKKFNTATLAQLLGAPARLLVLLIAMPFRALSGYLLGQTAPAALYLFLAWIGIKKSLGPQIRPKPFWKDDRKHILKYTAMVTLWLGVGTLSAALFTMIIRQRLPEIESAAYYIISRLAEINLFIGTTLSFVMFPLAAESHTKGSENIPLLKRMFFGTIIIGGLFTLFIGLCGKWILQAVPLWQPYVPFAPEMTLLTATYVVSMATSSFVNYEVAYERFSFLSYIIPIGILHTTFLICFTGYGFFRGILPHTWVDWMASLHIAKLSTILWISFAVNLIVFFINLIHLALRLLQRKGLHS